MNTIANSLPLISVSMLFAWIIAGMFFHLPKIRRTSTRKRLIMVLLVFVFVRYIPIFNGMSGAYILRGVLGDLCITTTFLLLTFIYGEITGNNNCYKISNTIYLVVSIIDLVLCLSVFGCIPIDIYSFGYFPEGLLVFYLIIQIFFWQLNKKFAFFWLLALIGYMLKVLPSPNLWDYLIDPALLLISLFSMIAFYLLKFKKK